MPSWHHALVFHIFQTSLQWKLLKSECHKNNTKPIDVKKSKSKTTAISVMFGKSAKRRFWSSEVEIKSQPQGRQVLSLYSFLHFYMPKWQSGRPPNFTKTQSARNLQNRLFSTVVKTERLQLAERNSLSWQNINETSIWFKCYQILANSYSATTEPNGVIVLLPTPKKLAAIGHRSSQQPEFFSVTSSTTSVHCIKFWLSQHRKCPFYDVGAHSDPLQYMRISKNSTLIKTRTENILFTDFWYVKALCMCCGFPQKRNENFHKRLRKRGQTRKNLTPCISPTDCQNSFKLLQVLQFVAATPCANRHNFRISHEYFIDLIRNYIKLDA